MAGSVMIVRGDARTLPLSDASVDLIVTSPPYWSLRSYQDGGAHYAGQIGSEVTPGEYIDALIECTREWMRVLKPSGSIWVNLGDKYNSAASGQNLLGIRARNPGSRSGSKRYDGGRHRAAHGISTKSLHLLPERYRIACVDQLGLIVRAVVIWEKPNGLPESVTDRVRRSHEDWVHLTTQRRYYSAIDQIREPVLHPNWSRPNRNDMPSADARRDIGETSALRNVYTPNPNGKLPASVWAIATQPFRVPPELGIDHFAAFPMEWPRRLIKGWCQPDGVVLDPFGGTGTTALVAAMLSRTGITVDASADYCRLAQWRCSDPIERAKAAQVEPDRRLVDPGQTDLFGTAS